MTMLSNYQNSATFNKQYRSRAIRLRCLECCGDCSPAVKECSDIDCPLWPYRHGSGIEVPSEKQWAEYQAGKVSQKG